MKKYFHGYYKPTNEEFDAIWNDAIIVVDANVLLNLYTYSATTAQEVLSLFGEFVNRLWVPHQVALEYHKNRCGIILKESKRYADISKELEKVGTELRTKQRHPYITIELATKFEVIEAEIKKELENGERKHRDLITTDSICEKITELLDGKVGSPMTDEVLESVYKEGKTRYTGNIPPGFSDIKKPEPDRYGDLVLWYQLIEHAKTSRLSVILVTDDLKEDWWSLAGDRRIGPRPELRHEFRAKTECEIYIYSSDTFLENAKKRGKKLSESATEEIESSSLERQQGDSSPLEEFRMQKEIFDRLTHDTLEQYREQERLRKQQLLSISIHDPLERYREQERLLDKLTRDPLEGFRRQQDILDQLKRDSLGSSLEEEVRRQQKVLEECYRLNRLAHDPLSIRDMLKRKEDF